MKSKAIIITLISSFFFIISSVNAESSCAYQEQADLNNIVANIKTNYESATGIVDPSEYGLPDTIEEDSEAAKNYQVEYYYLKVSILNITKDTYLVIKNDIDDQIINVNYTDTNDGIYTFNWENVNQISNLTINVYSSDSTNCKDELYRTIYVQLPRYNDYYFNSQCENNRDFYLCKQFVTFGNVSLKDFNNKLLAYTQKQVDPDGNTLTKENGFTKFFKEHQTILIIGGIVIILTIGGVITVNTLSKRRKTK